MKKIIQLPLFLSMAIVAGLSITPASQAAPARGAPPTPSAYTPNAASRPFGLGIIIGDPTGLTGKYWKSFSDAYDFGLAFNVGDYFLLYGDYLHHFKGAFGNSTPFFTDLTPYIGIGGLIAFSTDDRYRGRRSTIFDGSTSSTGVGVRIPLGAEWRPAPDQIGVFLEFVPGLAIVPGTSGFFQAGIGVRFYF